jgi:hypothetical protein
MHINGGTMRKFAVLVTGLLLMTAGSAFAQESKGDVSVGYRLLTFSDPTSDDTVTFGKGWYVDASGNIGPVVSIVGEVAGSYKSDEETFGALNLKTDLNLHSFMGGVRFRASANPRVVPFGQILFGGARGKTETESKITVGSTTTTTTDETSDTNAVMAIDGGVNLTAGSIGVRAAVGYARYFTDDGDTTEDEATNGFRLSIGIVFPF